MATVYIQDACANHMYIRSKDTSNIVERPERLRAVKIGIAGAIGRLSLSSTDTAEVPIATTNQNPDELADALAGMKIGGPAPIRSDIRIVQSSATINLLSHPAVKYVHGDIDGDFYLEDVKKWAQTSWEKIGEGGSEIPETTRKGQKLNQGDLYRMYKSTHGGKVHSFHTLTLS